VETYLKQAPEAPNTSGNLFTPSEFGTSIYGGWNTKSDADERKRTVGSVALVAGIAAGIFYLLKSAPANKAS
ncbi:MAG: short chain dehydrogenase, partial [Segetibacter sp.]|nr:short chain dehydrogenase [Segetibacter sp.]